MGTIQVSYDKWSEEITETRIRKAIRRTKNKKAVDRLGWAAEWVKGGEEMVKSLYRYILFNRIKTENQIPKQLPLTKVKGIH